MSGAFPWLSAAALSDIGRKRKNNEDAFGAFPESGIWCVSDGMGGGDDGEIASSATIRAVAAAAAALEAPEGGGRIAAETAAGVSAALSAASGWIFARTRRNGLKTCGATFAGVAFDATAPSSALAMHAGDSRVYRIRGRSIKQITRDHSAAELAGVKDENKLNPALRGVILRAVGVEKTVQTETTPFDVAEGDLIVICSDGLSKMVPDKGIRKIASSAKGDPETAAKKLVDAANAAGGTDNVTVVAICVGALPPPLPAAPPAPPPDPGTCGESEFDSDTAETVAGTETGEVEESSPDASGAAVRADASPRPAPRDDSVPDLRTLILEQGARSRRRRMIPVSMFKLSLCASLLLLAGAVVFALTKQRRPAAESPSAAETASPAPERSVKAQPPPPTLQTPPPPERQPAPPPELQPAPPPANPAPQPSAIPDASGSVAESPSPLAKADVAGTSSPAAAKKLRNLVQGDAGLAFLAKSAEYGADDGKCAECIFERLKWDCLRKHPELRGNLSAPAEQEAWDFIIDDASKGKTPDEYAAAALIVKALKEDLAKIGAKMGAGGRR